jgi:putative transposase
VAGRRRRSLRAISVRGHFPTEQAALKTLYPVTRGTDRKGTGQARWVTRWKPELDAFAVTFADRIAGRREPLNQ